MLSSGARPLAPAPAVLPDSPSPPMTPSPPALDTAAASSGPAYMRIEAMCARRQTAGRKRSDGRARMEVAGGWGGWGSPTHRNIHPVGKQTGRVSEVDSKGISALCTHPASMIGCLMPTVTRNRSHREKRGEVSSSPACQRQLGQPRSRTYTSW